MTLRRPWQVSPTDGARPANWKGACCHLLPELDDAEAEHAEAAVGSLWQPSPSTWLPTSTAARGVSTACLQVTGAIAGIEENTGGMAGTAAGEGDTTGAATATGSTSTSAPEAGLCLVITSSATGRLLPAARAHSLWLTAQAPGSPVCNSRVCAAQAGAMSLCTADTTSHALYAPELPPALTCSCSRHR